MKNYYALLLSVLLLIGLFASTETTADAQTSPYSLTPSTASAQPGSNISVTWIAPSGSSVKDWVGLYLKVNSNQGFGNWIYTNGATSGTFSTTAPATPGTYEFRYLLNDGFTDVVRSASLTVAVGPPPPPVILTSSLANGNLGQPYSQTLQTSGGTTPFHWSISSGALPLGLTVNTGGVIAGTPSQLGVFNFAVRLQDSASRVATASLSINVTPPPASPYTLSISSASVQPGAAISTTWTAPAGSSGQDWVSLYLVGNPNTSFGNWTYTNGATSGTFSTTAPATPGTYEFRYLLNNGYTDAARSAPITVAVGPPPPPVILTSSLANGNLGQPYTQTLQTSGGTTPFQWSITSGALPPGLTLNTGGVIAGTPSQLGLVSFTVKLQDSAQRVATANLSINVIPPPPSPYTLSLSSSSVLTGAAISTTWTAPAGSSVKDWVRLYLASDPNTANGAWTYTNGATSGTFTTTAPANPGTYEFRYLLNDGYNVAARSTPITVVSGTTLAPSPTTVFPNAMISVTISNAPPSNTNWVGVFAPGAGGTGPISWKYLNGLQTAPASSIPNAILSFNVPPSVGTYQFRLYRNNSTSESDRVATADFAAVAVNVEEYPPVPNPTLGEGPGGPILLITSVANPFSRYYAEILRTEGLNLFTTMDVNSVSTATLGSFDSVILTEMPLATNQVTMFENWVNAGGNLIAMRPDKKLQNLLGISDTGSTIQDSYISVNAAGDPGRGIASQTMQFHGTADKYSLASATPVAMLYSSAVTATPNPAVTLRSVGVNGGQAAAFTYDLARSIIFTRQGNPAWAAQERDGSDPIRSDDLFFGAKSGDIQPDWVDLSKVAIPQADEQQRLLANLILHMNSDKKPLPRFWYFPNNKKAVVVMTGDEHSSTNTQAVFERYKSQSTAGCSVQDWECIRATSYLYTDPNPNAHMTNTTATSYHANYNFSSISATYTDQLGTFGAKYSSLPSPVTQRAHCVVWSDWLSQAQIELQHGIRMDTTYYYALAAWVQNRPGFFTGSGMPMRFAYKNGEMIDVFQATTQMTDESGQSYPFTIDTLLTNALGPNGYYGAFVANMHNDNVVHPSADAIVTAAKSRGVPVVSAKQMLDWLDARNSSNFSGITWNQNKLTFSISQASGARNLRAMLPIHAPSGSLSVITKDGSPVAYSAEIIKGIDYAIFPATSGTYLATY